MSPTWFSAVLLCVGVMAPLGLGAEPATAYETLPMPRTAFTFNPFVVGFRVQIFDELRAIQHQFAPSAETS